MTVHLVHSHNQGLKKQRSHSLIQLEYLYECRFGAASGESHYPDEKQVTRRENREV